MCTIIFVSFWWSFGDPFLSPFLPGPPPCRPYWFAPMSIGSKVSVKSMKKAVEWHGQWQRLGQTVADYGLFADDAGRLEVDKFIRDPSAFHSAFGATRHRYASLTLRGGPLFFKTKS